jgi:HPP family
MTWNASWWAKRLPDAVWAPVWEGALILLVGGAAWAAGQPWLFASLGPTVYEQVEKPELRSAGIYNVIVGHFVGLGAGFLGLWVAGAWNSPKVVASTTVSPERLWAAVIAVTVTTIGNLLLKSGQPAALSTTLLVALGTYQTARGALWVAVGVVIVGLVGEPIRRLRIPKQPSAEKSPT